MAIDRCIVNHGAIPLGLDQRTNGAVEYVSKGHDDHVGTSIGKACKMVRYKRTGLRDGNDLVGAHDPDQAEEHIQSHHMSHARKDIDESYGHDKCGRYDGFKVCVGLVSQVG